MPSRRHLADRLLRCVRVMGAAASLVLSGTSANARPSEWRQSSGNLTLAVRSDGSYSVFVGKTEWLPGALTAVRVGGRWYKWDPSRRATCNLKKIAEKRSSGKDALGPYEACDIHWMARSTPFDTGFRIYKNRSTIVFSQYFPRGAKNAAVDRPDNLHRDVLSAFPCFKRGRKLQELNYLTYEGIFAAPRQGKGLVNYCGGTEGGVPLALIDTKLTTVLLSPLTEFKALIPTAMVDSESLLAFGLQGQMREVPSGYRVETILTQNSGVNNTFLAWGSQLLDYHHKKRRPYRRDLVSDYLGYWTNAGAYYYYKTEPQKNYQQTLMELRAYHRSINLPVRYYELDSWWYQKGKDEGVTTWQAKADVFPDGMPALKSLLGEPLVLHNRYWSLATPYAKRYQFARDTTSPVPIDPRLWDELFQGAKEAGAVTYIQDWLSEQYKRSQCLKESVDLYHKWLATMGSEAARFGISILYCMPLPSDFLETAEIPQVTAVRVSRDYRPGNDQWQIGPTAMLARALDLAPFKDNFWTTERQPGNTYEASEPNTVLQALVAAMSAGPVGISDKIGLTDRALVMRTCRDDGLLLKPDRPATPIDRSFLEGRTSGQITETETKIGSQCWHFLLAVNQRSSYKINAKDIGLSSTSVMLDADSGAFENLDTACGTSIVSRDRGSSSAPFSYYIIAPRTTGGLAFLGEANKFITVSRARFAAISEDAKTIAVKGAARERVSLEWLAPEAPSRVEASGTLVPETTSNQSEGWSYDDSKHVLRVSFKLPTSGGTIVRLFD